MSNNYMMSDDCLITEMRVRIVKILFLVIIGIINCGNDKGGNENDKEKLS